MTSSRVKKNILTDKLELPEPKKQCQEPTVLTRNMRRGRARRIKRINKGLVRTNTAVARRAESRSENYTSKYHPAFYEEQKKGKYWCLLHAVHNALGDSSISAIDVETDRKDPKRSVRPAGGMSGFWDVPFFLRFLQHKCKLSVRHVRLRDHDGKLSTKIEPFITQNPDWRSHRYILLLQYDHKDPKKGGGDYPPDKIIVAGHAVALVDGYVLDSDTDFIGKFYPLEEYPLRDTIKSIYKIAKHPVKLQCA